MLLLKSSCNEQRAIIVFFCGQKSLNANEIHSEMHSAYGNKCFTKRTVGVTFGVKSARLAEICIRYWGAVSRSSMARIAASIVLCIEHAEEIVVS